MAARSLIMHALRCLLPVPLLLWSLSAHGHAPYMLLAQADETGTALEDTAAEPDAAIEEESGDFDEDFDDEFADDFDDDFGNGAEPLKVSDPLEPINRGFFWFNDKLYFYVLKPVAKAFRVLPEGARASIANFFQHWTTPARFVSCLMQAKLNDAGTELGRFVINTTLGIGGLFDPAKEKAGLRRKDEDFGQALGAYGVGPGIYLVVPVFGPRNVRDGLGGIVDGMMDPRYILLEEDEYWVTRGVDAVNELSLDKDTYEAIKRDALDPYLFIRDAYMQNRAGKVAK